MDSNELFEKLIGQEEIDIVDFKRDMYNLSSPKKKEDLVLDVVSMANTIRDASAYIVLGVKKDSGCPPELFGIGDQIDDSTIANIFWGSKYINLNLATKYHPVAYQGKNFGIIEVPLSKEGPFYITYEIYREGRPVSNVLWYRNSTNNTPAHNSYALDILNWFEGRGTIGEFKGWKDYLLSNCNFERGTFHSLICERFDGRELSRYLGNAPWSLIIDFDLRSEEKGLHSIIHKELSKSRPIHLVIDDNRSEISDNNTIWYMGMGVPDRQRSTPSSNSLGDWRRLHKRNIDGLVGDASRRLSPFHHTVTILWNSGEFHKHISLVLEIYADYFAELVNFVFVVSSHDIEPELNSLADMYEAEIVVIDPKFFSNNFRMLNAFEQSEELSSFPNRTGGESYVEQSDLLWVNEDFYTLPANYIPEDTVDEISYYKGASIGWADLSNRRDCEREIYSDLADKLGKKLVLGKNKVVSLFHEPGAGGSSVAYRALWEYRRKYPCLVMKKFSPKVSAQRVEKIYTVTDKTCLILVDSSDISTSSVDELINDLKALNVPAIVLKTCRSGKAVPKNLFLESKLRPIESERFCDSYSLIRPDKKNNFRELKEKSSINAVSPFIYGLTAFGEDFMGIPSYVKERLRGVNTPQKNALCFLSLAHLYGHCSIPAQFFASYFGAINERIFKIEKIFDNDSSALDLLQISGLDIRPIHVAISKEIIKQSLHTNNIPWNMRLAELYGEFIRFLSNIPGHPDGVVVLAKKVFINRDYNKTSKAILDLPEYTHKESVLRLLVDTFPNEAHFYAHLGRFYSSCDEFKSALKYLDKALDLNGNDSVLFHMHGMAHKKIAEAKIKSSETYEDISFNLLIAQESFKTSRSLAPSIEYGYISEVQLLIKIADYVTKTENVSAQLLPVCNVPDSFKKVLIDAEELLMEYRSIQMENEMSSYEKTCLSDIYSMYENYSGALQILDNALKNRSMGAREIRTQIVKTHFHKNNHSWANFSSKNICRCIDLLEDNIAEDPSDGSSIRHWLSAIRLRPQPPSLSTVLDKLIYWRTASEDIESIFYLYVINFLLALDGSKVAYNNARKFIDECRNIATYSPTRSLPREWLGFGNGVCQLIHFTQLRGMSREQIAESPRVRYQEGRIARIDKPHKGFIDYEGFYVFFNPARSQIVKDKDENKLVKFQLAFTYDGLIANSVDLK